MRFTPKFFAVFALLIRIETATCGDPLPAKIADTATITLDRAEEQFLKNNLQLLAARFGVSAAEAAVCQAGLWSNPNISIEQNAYNRFTNRYFDVTKTGNTDIQLQQLILLAGKRDKEIRLAEINTQIAEETFYSTLRALKFELHTDFFDLYFLQKSLAFYNQTIPAVRKTVTATEAIYQQRAILLSEVLRLKSLLFSLENERLGLLNKISQTENDISVLLRDSSRIALYYVPQLDGGNLDSDQIDRLSLPDILAGAAENRPDFKIADAQARYEEENLSLQKALRIPDIIVGGTYSRAGSYIPDYYALTVSVDLPIFNRNQGNIEVSEQNLEADKVLREHTRIKIDKEIADAYRKAAATDSLYKSFDKKFTDEYKSLVEGMNASYEKRNVTIIEFTDFYESYRTSMLQMNQLQNDRVDAFEALNYAAGTTVIKP
jgi:cobalt-zinc-cadmium efflux system outer membrane protein